MSNFFPKKTDYSKNELSQYQKISCITVQPLPYRKLITYFIKLLLVITYRKKVQSAKNCQKSIKSEHDNPVQPIKTEDRKRAFGFSTFRIKQEL